MAANSFNLGDLLKLQNTNAAFQAAKYGGGASGGNGKGGGLLNILSGAYQAAFPNAPAANLIAGGVQARNLYKYNQALQAQQQAAMLAQQQKNSNDAKNFYEATGVEVKGDFDRGFANNMSGAIRENNTNPLTKNYIDTGKVDPSLYNSKGNYNQGISSEILKSAMERANAGNDTQATLDRLPQFMGSPVPNQVGTPQGGLSAMIPQGTGPQLQMDPSQGPLQGNVAETTPVFTMANAGTQGIPDISQLLTGRKNEQGDRLGNRKAIETARNNRATNANQRITANASKTNAKANMIRANKYQPSSGSNNPYTVPKEQQQYFNGQIKAVDNELKSLGFVKTGGKIKIPKIDNSGLSFNNTSPQKVAQIERAQELMTYKKQLQLQMGLPFGGQSKQKLDNTNEDIQEQSKSIYPGKG